MPYLTKTVKDTVEKGNVITNMRYINYLNQETTLNGRIIESITRNFYANLCELLKQTGIDITYDEEYCTFSVFGLTFGVYCYAVKHTSDNNHYTVIPAIVRYYDYAYDKSLMDFPTLTREGYATNFSCNSESICCNYTHCNDLFYKINIYYNTNFLYITYGSYYNIGLEYPICSLIQGKTVDNKDIVYCSGDCNTYNSVNNAHIYHKLVLPENQFTSAETSIPSYDNLNVLNAGVNSVALNQMGIFSRILDTRLIQAKILTQNTLKNKMILVKPICCGGAVSFDNIYVLPEGYAAGVYYEIDGETYYSPQTQRQILVLNTYPDSKYHMQRLLFKL